MTSFDVVTVIQARRASTRFPDKVLLPIGGFTALERIVQRVRLAHLVGTVVVATTTDPGDDVIAAVCRAARIPCVRGHPTDLLDRHVRTGRQFGARHLVKIPSDCVLIDPCVIDAVLSFYLAHADRLDYASNLHPPSCPDGNDVEVCSMTALETAWREAQRPYEREHTTPFIWDQPERFRLGNVCWGSGGDLSRSHRLVLDYPEDYEVIRRVFDALYLGDASFGIDTIVAWLDAHPEVAAINARYRGVNWYRHNLGELRTVSPADTRNPEEVACELA